jgi:uncharacterized protein YciI
MYVVLLEYVQPLEVVLAKIDALLPEHRAFLDRHYAAGHFVASGAQVPRVGGVILARPMPKETLEAILAEDAFHREKVATYRIIEFTPSRFAPGAETFFTS